LFQKGIIVCSAVMFFINTCLYKPVCTGLYIRFHVVFCL